ncbi:MAG: acyl-CoA dehydrogenase C-terminal domain-containing protein [Gammaproteobacteria bacterium]|nr:acyl-CoA dehydrogenase C-terminal domain-containing protein [Gammaproteobacteria bacterium]MDP2347694.1 acyl-CoA dehydrogenase C-terminal domain-containing protein [Gammaproteobacteria bacterium]
MATYKAPIKDMRFILHEVMGAEALFASMPGTEEVTADLMDAILESAATMAEEVLAPLNRSGDEEGCRFDNGCVETPKGFIKAYRAFADGGWIGLSGDVEHGGQGMPKMLAVLFEEMIMGANSSFALYPILSAGASLAIARHATPELQKVYLPKLYSGEWSGTMCLTESHAGTDLGIIKSRAEPQPDGSYLISGSKIFITGGQHDLTRNIIHLVLVKLPESPPGPKGISLFLVPRNLPNDQGEAGEPNNVSCGNIEHKMGIKASATCVINFDGARGYLVGEINKGLSCMFTMMNYERLSIGLQGLGLSESSYQVAAAYARDRLQGRASNAPANPKGMADPIIVHPDVRRMLLTVRADIEAGRALALYVASQLDLAHFHEDEAVRARAAKLVALLTPVAKAAFSDRGFEDCVLAQQVLGGHGYVREWGLEQNVRDARIAQIYEGTNGIQSLDLAGRKVVRDSDGLLDVLAEEIEEFILERSADRQVEEFVAPLREALEVLLDTTGWLKEVSALDPNEIGAASVPYLRLMTLILYSYMWARMAVAAVAALQNGSEDAGFYDAKLKTGRFFLARVLPGYKSLVAEVRGGSAVLMALAADQF